MLQTLRQYRVLLVSLGLLTAASVYGALLAPKIEAWVVERTRDAGFVLNDLELDGVVRASRAEVLAALDVDSGVPLLSIDLERIRAQLEMLPWVKRAEVSRILPGKLKINITEREPFALWQQDGTVRLIDEAGHVITKRGLSDFAHLIMVVRQGADQKVSDLHEMLDNAPALSARIKTAVFVSERRWDLIFDNGVRVKLPEGAPAQYDAQTAWQKFATLQGEYRLLEREVSVIDMRLPDRMVLRVSPEGRRIMDGTGWAT